MLVPSYCPFSFRPSLLDHHSPQPGPQPPPMVGCPRALSRIARMALPDSVISLIQL